MPRADPDRSPYCASRHLLRNLDDARELRRNPLVRNLFAPERVGARDGDHERRAVARIRRRVTVTLAGLRDQPRGGRAVRLGRVHAALLRCEIDSQPLAVVAAELGLSERQLRRERQTAHALFLRAFDGDAPAPAETRRAMVAADTAAVRVSEGVELHELGESDLAERVLLDVERGAPAAERRIEAACAGAEVALERGRLEAARERLDEARALLGARGEELDERARLAAEQHVDLAEWCVRWRTELVGGVAARPPLVVAHADAVQAFAGERHRALLVRALAAYADQRWECGDARAMQAALERAAALLRTIDPARVKEQLAVAFAQARAIALADGCAKDAEARAFAALEERASNGGHVRTALRARSERFGGTTSALPRLARASEEMERLFGPRERREMPIAFAGAARIVAQEESADRVAGAAQLAEESAPARSANVLLARCARVRAAYEVGAYDDAAALAQAVLADAEMIGNPRVRGSAHRYLGQVAAVRGIRNEAVRHTGEALSLLEHFGTAIARKEARRLARGLGVN
ncbi:MAG TPA: hypothetical protein VFB22_03600 [Candidatus Baltobacteraceae bacterium]|nr:hypothetical protein [Candidatus Baltobacteraceae bacterium]